MAADDDQGYVPLQGQKQGAPVVAPPPKAVVAAPKPVDPNDQGYAPLQTGGGQQQPPPPSSAAQPGDWSTVAWNESLMGTIPGLRAQAEAARQRLGPTGAASADAAGGFASPTTALNFIPYVGPELAGGAHEGIKSAVTNWTPDQSWSQYLTNVGKDTAGGVAGGLIGHGAGKAFANPELLKLGVGGITAKLTHPYFSGDWREAAGALGAYRLANTVSEKAADAIASPAAQAAIRSLALGGTAALRASSPGPLWDQWIPGN